MHRSVTTRRMFSLFQMQMFEGLEDNDASFCNDTDNVFPVSDADVRGSGG